MAGRVWDADGGTVACLVAVGLLVPGGPGQRGLGGSWTDQPLPSGSEKKQKRPHGYSWIPDTSTPRSRRLA